MKEFTFHFFRFRRVMGEDFVRSCPFCFLSKHLYAEKVTQR